MTEPTDNTPTDPAETAETVADPPPSDSEPSPNSEAARYRVQLREAEAQRDAMAERITGYQRRECESVVADLLDEAADLWDIGQANVADFYGEDGELDEGELRAAAGALCDMRPRLAKPQGPRHHNFGQYAAQPPPSSAGWGELLK